MKKSSILAIVFSLMLLVLLGGCGEEKTSRTGEWEYESTGVGKISILRFKGIDTDVKIPEKIDGKTVVCIGDHAFEGTSVEEVEIPSTVTEVGESAFQGCKKMVKLTLNDGLSLIDKAAFKGCLSLGQISIPASVQEIRSESFASCQKLKEIVIPEENELEFIAMNAFEASGWYIEQPKGPFSLAGILIGVKGEIEQGTLIIPEGVTKISNACLTSLNVTRVVFPSTIREIGGAFKRSESLLSVSFAARSSVDAKIDACGDAFSGCKNLQEAHLSNAFAAVPDGLFEKCASLKSVDMDDSVQCIGVGTFQGCTSLSEIYLPTSLNTIEANAFSGCTALKDIDFSTAGSLRNLGETAFSNSGLIQVSLPDSIQVSGEGVFMNCENLKSVTVNCKTISTRMFAKCPKLTTVYLENGCEEVGHAAFTGCGKSITVHVGPSVSPIATDAFGKLGEEPQDLRIYGEDGSYAQVYANNHRVLFVKE